MYSRGNVAEIKKGDLRDSFQMYDSLYYKYNIKIAKTVNIPVICVLAPCFRSVTDLSRLRKRRNKSDKVKE